MIFTYLLLSLGINIALFIPAFMFKTDKLTDMSYSVSFIVLVLVALFRTTTTLPSVIIGSLILLWALRLGTFLVIRIAAQKKDKRFDEIRDSLFSFFFFWVSQAVLVWVLLFPFFFATVSSSTFFNIAGIALLLIGLVIETVADIQKFRHKKKSKNFISTGLWKYSRHPNYFGEILFWIGVYLALLPTLSFVPAIVSVASPLAIIFILLFVTGVPPLEQHGRKKWGAAYKEYQKKTSMLIPWKVKKQEL